MADDKQDVDDRLDREDSPSSTAAAVGMKNDTPPLPEAAASPAAPVTPAADAAAATGEDDDAKKPAAVNFGQTGPPSEQVVASHPHLRGERRGSGFLLLAAEAYEAAERTQLRADAIRRVAVELATAAGADIPQGSSQEGSSAVGAPGGEGLRERVYMAAARMQQERGLPPSARDGEGEESGLTRRPRRRASGKGARPPSPPPLPPAGQVAQGRPREGSLNLSNPQRLPVKHVYHDYSTVPDSEQYVRKKTGGVTIPFPEKLMTMLDIESARRPSIVSWLSHGRAFLVRRPKEFSRDVMGDHFRQSKLTSFQRQLNLYGFRRITRGADAGAYYHELFLRGRPKLCMRMQRMKVKGTGHKQPTDASTEPNFYAMPSLTAEAAEGGGGGDVEYGGTSDGTGGNDAPLPSYMPMSGSAPPPLAPLDATYTTTPLQSPGLNAAAMLRRLSASNISNIADNVRAPPFSQGAAAAEASQEAGVASAPVGSGDQPVGSCAKATAAAEYLAAMGNASGYGSSRRSSLGEVEYV